MPFPLNTGGNQGQFHMTNHLRDLLDISMIFPLKKTQQLHYHNLKDLWKNVNFFPYFDIDKRIFIKKYLSKIRKYALNLLNSKDCNILRMNSALNTSSPKIFDSSFLELVRKVIIENSFDLIQVEFYPFMPLIHVLPTSIKTIFVHHEIRFVRNERELELIPDRTIQDEYLFLLYKSIELATLKKYNAIITVTENDREKLKTLLPEKEVFSSHLFIPKSTKALFDENFNFNKKFVFVGSGCHYPNLDGIQWFLSSFWNKIHEKNKDFEFHIIGNWKKNQIAQYIKKYKNVYFDGYVNDLYDAISNCIMIIPLRIGSGMRMKIMDAINAKIPFVSTTVGIEGLDFKSGIDCLVADGIEFADAILEMATNVFLQQMVIKNALHVSDVLYSTEDLYLKRFKIYENLI